MGRPSFVKPRPAGSTRRDFFSRSGRAAAAMAAAPLLTVDLAEASGSAFQHGVASGDPLSDRVILWTRISPANPALVSSTPVTWVVALDPELSQIVSSGSVFTSEAVDFTVKVDVTGLQAGSTYYYRFGWNKSQSPKGRTRTLPVGSVERLRLAVVSCSNVAAGYFNAYQLIAQRADLDAVIHLGDYLYEYGSGQYGSVRACEPEHEILTLADYRTRHAQHKRDADSRAMHRQHPLIAIWDDHETANNAWQGGAENHTEGTEGRWPARVRAALQAYYEWMPIRQPKPNAPRQQQRRFVFGDLVDLFMLEERLGARSKQLDSMGTSALGPVFMQMGDYLDPTRTLLGQAQEQQLISGLRQSGARWKMLGQGVMFAQLKAQGAPNAQGGGAFLNSDQWDGYQPARDRIYAAIKGTDGKAPINNLVVLTGDIHSSWAADLTQDPNNPDTSTGGYDAGTGQGAVAVEFVGTSVTSPGLDDASGQIAAYLRSQNPHFKYVDLNKRGYMIVDANASRVLCEWWHLNTITAPDSGQTLAAAFQVLAGQGHLSAAAASVAPSKVPPLAP